MLSHKTAEILEAFWLGQDDGGKRLARLFNEGMTKTSLVDAFIWHCETQPIPPELRAALATALADVKANRKDAATVASMCLFYGTQEGQDRLDALQMALDSFTPRIRKTSPLIPPMERDTDA